VNFFHAPISAIQFSFQTARASNSEFNIVVLNYGTIAIVSLHERIHAREGSPTACCCARILSDD
jgi:hypothetical protein